MSDQVPWEHTERPRSIYFSRSFLPPVFSIDVEVSLGLAKTLILINLISFTIPVLYFSWHPWRFSASNSPPSGFDQHLRAFGLFWCSWAYRPPWLHNHSFTSRIRSMPVLVPVTRRQLQRRNSRDNLKAVLEIRKPCRSYLLWIFQAPVRYMHKR